jgi:glycosyltransferase involved in cell wall biosynthesis
LVVPDVADDRPCVRILGTHGVPANYGGFETAAENVARYLVDHGWRVVVYCQTDHDGPVYEDVWNGIERVNISVPDKGWLGTSRFDWLSIRDAVRHGDLCLTFGYNTAVFNVLQRVRGIPNVINMDGIEWSRERWGPTRQAILYVNERIGCWVGNELIADHPELNTYLQTRAPARKITTITYGAHPIASAPSHPVTELGLRVGGYLTVIARPIPENSILELVQGFSARPRGVELAILGDYQPDGDDYHRAVVAAASDEVRFLGAIYDPQVVQSLRYHALGYLHGHTVGGTNPSLVEALAAGNPVVAHDNKYNRWVADGAALYFASSTEVDVAVGRLVEGEMLRRQLRHNALTRFESEFTWEKVAGEYEALLRKALGRSPRRSVRRG